MGERRPLDGAGPSPAELESEAILELYERHIESLRAWAKKRVEIGTPVSPEELIHQVNARFPEDA